MNPNQVPKDPLDDLEHRFEENRERIRIAKEEEKKAHDTARERGTTFPPLRRIVEVKDELELNLESDGDDVEGHRTS